MSTRIANIISIVGIILLGAYVAWMYPGLPDPMPTHWNAAGEVDGYSSKPVGAAIIASIPVLSFVIFKLIPVISPRGFRTESFTGTLNIIMVATVLFGCVLGVGLVRASHDTSINISSFVYVAVGLLFVVLGNFLGKVRKNFFLGIRTPWTLSNEIVWQKTHKLGGVLFRIERV